jgi:hypothetical protein
VDARAQFVHPPQGVEGLSVRPGVETRLVHHLGLSVPDPKGCRKTHGIPVMTEWRRFSSTALSMPARGATRHFSRGAR